MEIVLPVIVSTIVADSKKNLLRTARSSCVNITFVLNAVIQINISPQTVKKKIPVKHVEANHMHQQYTFGFIEHKPRVNHGEEKKNQNIPEQDEVTKCTQICKQQFSGKSCAKIVQVNIHKSDSPNKTLTFYAILDDQSNKTLVYSSVLDTLGITCDATEYILTSCAGVIKTSGRQTDGLVTSLDGTVLLYLPLLKVIVFLIFGTKLQRQKWRNTILIYRN